MRKIVVKTTLFLSIVLFNSVPAFAQEIALDFIKKADEKLKGLTSQGTMTMTLVRPKWKRTIRMKSWTKGSDYSLTLILSPARDKGSAFLMRDKEIWNWVPSIDRATKLPPSMMMQSWMGSDFTNDDLVKQSSIVTDYEHSIIGEETIEDYECYKIQLIPKEDAPVVWGKIITWISKNEYLQLKAEFYDEDDFLVNTMNASKVKQMGDRLIPTYQEMIPAEKSNQKTILEINHIIFDKEIKDSFFSVQNMKRVR